MALRNHPEFNQAPIHQQPILIQLRPHRWEGDGGRGGTHKERKKKRMNGGHVRLTWILNDFWL